MWRRGTTGFVACAVDSAILADRDFPGCKQSSGEEWIGTERNTGRAEPVHKGHQGSEERDPKQPNQSAAPRAKGSREWREKVRGDEKVYNKQGMSEKRADSVSQWTVERDITQEEAAAMSCNGADIPEIISGIVAVWKSKIRGKRSSEVTARFHVQIGKQVK
ncbi:hypothetical protein B0H13DRAFT_1897373 [Mycena leptocephala]|nr:hypothetical protein B0H13DRAFT_1921081 [Mycena leptocephala]KAJ7867840.1 hypothetical protein B0H13DRAFT_1897373 [Mycena leptocephala]